ncbi:hypothetical protein Pmar_PMAR027189 [Perkinsus marinus ATCC 50983]|uniref:Uncharacterized protein n=1 Tax=Perkinsus marinus (strain ATCC 50983 / TXsc) TaxID=423536 RepID=C5L7Z8_PERM5|nr:hypothetical protein Pmar_PMAR027189 [Perkinsus marinus ATCC 50983]EER07144.1 hypothetical protein Pmar_PMAR027189 [Perkinsus marinus ATCC 50983]|eukprot:XP_002775328.1 hypothetical protein Pmar_PMAR027189 [Perkinsus marinus ATCC 50983]
MDVGGNAAVGLRSYSAAGGNFWLISVKETLVASKFKSPFKRGSAVDGDGVVKPILRRDSAYADESDLPYIVPKDGSTKKRRSGSLGGVTESKAKRRTRNDCSRSVCIFEAFRLSEKRQDVLQTVRQFHLAGRIGAEIFDWRRGVDQTAKPGNLFRTKSCEKIIDSVDHSNHEANVVAVVSGVISLLGFSILLVALLRSPRYQPAALPETRVSDTGKVQRRHKLD